MVQNGIFWTIGEKYYIGYYPIISYRKIKVYRVESMDIGRSQCNNIIIIIIVSYYLEFRAW